MKCLNEAAHYMNEKHVHSFSAIRMTDMLRIVIVLYVIWNKDS